MTSYCPHCGWPDAQPYEVVSRHATTQGQTVWTRCACGSLQVRTVGQSDGAQDTGVRIVSRGRPATVGQVRRPSQEPCGSVRREP
ncbi:hypothetical protein H1V43_17675 [Streptomyces sp. PSKA54]|uniref:Uncharacterized protein n=1 Tax=Streptomyces himalayensis subsp. aureolus TaxID=2758039 RepID=A0A7W2D1R3_9ACTN|nr:hypothetical protein [Streptomyces himalayensis]MBA4863179.1 hypothetical protein [Streptomyces himalayensis subsp. aureolus]